MAINLLNSSGLIDFLEHPPIGALPALTVDAGGPYTGNVTLDEFTDVDGHTHEVRNTFGMRFAWTVGGLLPDSGRFSLALGWEGPGANDPSEDTYVDRLLQIVVQHQTVLGAGIWLSDQVVEWHRPQGYVTWDQALPGRIGLYTFPGTYWFLAFWVKPGG